MLCSDTSLKEWILCGNSNLRKQADLTFLDYLAELLTVVSCLWKADASISDPPSICRAQALFFLQHVRIFLSIDLLVWFVPSSCYAYPRILFLLAVMYLNRYTSCNFILLGCLTAAIINAVFEFSLSQSWIKR